ncbi:MAG: M28 family peptidase, partial [Bacteroidota bacterium]
ELKLRAARERGVRSVFVVDPNFRDNLAEVRRRVINGRGMTMVDAQAINNPLANSIFISTDLARDLLGNNFKKVVKARKKIVRKGKPASVTIPVSVALTQMPDMRGLDGVNVLGYLEGSDPELKDELLVVSAHYDHIGRRGDVIFNGADDNGSGTSTVLEMAQAFMLAKQNGHGPRRSIAFMLVSGEEKGLLGSQYYVEHPIFPLEQTIANINIDMVGRIDEKHAENPFYIYVIGSDRLSTDLHRINEEANERFTQLELDYTYNAEDDPNRYYYRSDHYNFAERGIPAIFFFNGTHEDYHQATDTIEKINFEKMARIGQLAFHLAWDLTNRDERIKVDVGQ